MAFIRKREQLVLPKSSPKTANMVFPINKHLKVHSNSIVEINEHFFVFSLHICGGMTLCSNT